MSVCLSCEQLCSHLYTRPGIGGAKIELCSLLMHIWSVHCVWRLHTLGAGSYYLDPLADCDEIAFSVTRLYLSLPQCHSQYGRVIPELCSLFTHIWLGKLIACGGSIHSLLDHTIWIHSQIVERLRFHSRDSISLHPTATHSTVCTGGR